MKERTTLDICLKSMKGEEDDDADKLLCKVSIRRQKAFLQQPEAYSWLNQSDFYFNMSFPKELFSLNVKNASLIKAALLHRNSKKISPPLREIPTVSTLATLATFSPMKEHFTKGSFCIDKPSVTDWLEKVLCSINDLRDRCHEGDNFVCSANFWLSRLSYNQKLNLLQLDTGIIEDEQRSAFLEGVSSEFQLNFMLSATLCEYTAVLPNDEAKYTILDHLYPETSDQTTEYKKMLSSLTCTINNLQIALWLLVVCLCTSISLACHSKGRNKAVVMY
ncbi:protein FAM220A-like isoform X1 [Tachyglossus aculeatus]|uniref:protein FAM220A-like isoform X1 n=1 Tax=Tachyglossus aculeatus TaxID=9261 RepID=UPI0018F69D42|nr:protein FAM220A-like isoform X1 [Tachyglossus aculeatus]XP_038619037.1 protein FAM220A-like isoform X1 [Tachyglossus aculeatus]